MKRIGLKPIATKPINLKGIGYKTYRNYRYRYIKHIAGYSRYIRLERGPFG
jgi:hypothetical protein